MVSTYQHLSVAERIRDAFGPFANPFDQWKRHDVFRFPATKISQEAPLVRLDKAGQRELVIARWGLVPAWFKGDAADAKKFQGRTFNARGETLRDKASFRGAFKSRRCIVPALAFFEFRKPPGWKKGDNKERVRIAGTDGQPLAFAGLWEGWKSPDGARWTTFTVVTTTPNETVAALHNRMPAILVGEAIERWLDPETSREDAAGLLGPAGEGTLVIDGGGD